MLQNIGCEMCLITVENNEGWLVACVRKNNVVYVLDHQGRSCPPIQRVKVTEIILPRKTYTGMTDITHGMHDTQHTRAGYTGIIGLLFKHFSVFPRLTIAVGNIIPDNVIKHTAVTESFSDPSVEWGIRNVLAWKSLAICGCVCRCACVLVTYLW